MEQKSQEQIIKDQKNEIEELKKKLANRNTSFNKNLIDRSYSELRRLEYNIGEAIKNAIGQDLIHAFKYKKMQLDYETSLYSKGVWKVSFSSEDENKIRNEIADFQMKKFQESLDNFAWAINNQQG